MKSDMIKGGFQRAPHRGLLHACGVSNADINKPFIAVANSFCEIVPGHVHLNKVVAIALVPSATNSTVSPYTDLKRLMSAAPIPPPCPSTTQTRFTRTSFLQQNVSRPCTVASAALVSPKNLASLIKM